MGMGTWLYQLPSRDVDETKVWYLLDLGMRIGINFFYGDEYGIAKPMHAPLPSLLSSSGPIHTVKHYTSMRFNWFNCCKIRVFTTSIITGTCSKYRIAYFYISTYLKLHHHQSYASIMF